jgi:hypothetical protein
MQPRFVEREHGDAKSVAFTPKQILHRNFDVLEDQLGDRAAAQPNELLRAPYREA